MATGTKAAAAAEKQEKQEQEVPPPTTTVVLPTEDEMIRMALGRYRASDGGFDLDKLASDIERVKGKDESERIQIDIARKLQQKMGPYGVVEMTTATWDLGAKGKAHTLVTIAGYGLAAAVAAEVIGYYMDWPSFRLVTNLTGFLHR